MQSRGNCVANSPGVIETGPLLYRHWCVSNESISLTAQHPGGPPVHDYQCITGESSWIESAICHCIWLTVCQTRVQGNSRASATCVRCFGKLKRVSVTCTTSLISSMSSYMSAALACLCDSIQGSQDASPYMSIATEIWMIYRAYTSKACAVY